MNTHFTNTPTRIAKPPTSERNFIHHQTAVHCISLNSSCVLHKSFIAQHLRMPNPTSSTRNLGPGLLTCLQVAYTPHKMPAPNHVCSTKHRQQSTSALPLRAFRLHFTRSVQSSASQLELCLIPRAYASPGQ